jgi:3-oxoacyl-[acyl-carrier protein] reductase
LYRRRIGDLSNNVAIVTGSTRGLGEEMARRLFADGARVVVAGRTVERARELAAELDPAGERALGLELDVASRQSFAALIEATMRRWGRIDILVNNAGTTASTPFLQLDDAEWDAVLATNLRSVFIGSQLAVPIMRAQRYGRNMATPPGATPGPAMDELAVDTSKLPGMIPVGRVGTAAEVAAAVSFLASREAGYITGATLDINGGLYMR